MRGQGARGDVNDVAGELAGNLEHVGDHQQQALGGGERGAECSSLQRAMHGTRGPALALQFGDQSTVPQIFLRPASRHSSAHSAMVEDGVIG